MSFDKVSSTFTISHSWDGSGFVTLRHGARAELPADAGRCATLPRRKAKAPSSRGLPWDEKRL